MRLIIVFFLTASPNFLNQQVELGVMKCHLNYGQTVAVRYEVCVELSIHSPQNRQNWGAWKILKIVLSASICGVFPPKRRFPVLNALSVCHALWLKIVWRLVDRVHRSRKEMIWWHFDRYPLNARSATQWVNWRTNLASLKYHQNGKKLSKRQVSMESQ